MGAIFFRRCKVCGEILKFLEKNKVEVFPCKCKTCRKTYIIQETKDIK